MVDVIYITEARDFSREDHIFIVRRRSTKDRSQLVINVDGAYRSDEKRVTFINEPYGDPSPLEAVIEREKIRAAEIGLDRIYVWDQAGLVASD